MTTARALTQMEKKHALVAYKGSECHDCMKTFPDCCYDFDHRNPHEKAFTISAGYRKPLSELMIEADKCDLVCSNCHRVRTTGNPIVAEKMSAGAKGKIISAETRAKFSASRKGRKLPPLSEEHKAKLRVAMLGNTYALGIKHTAESRARMSVAHLGKKRSPEARKNMSLAMTGKTKSAAHKIKCREAGRKGAAVRWGLPYVTEMVQ